MYWVVSLVVTCTIRHYPNTSSHWYSAPQIHTIYTSIILSAHFFPSSFLVIWLKTRDCKLLATTWDLIWRYKVQWLDARTGVRQDWAVQDSAGWWVQWECSPVLAGKGDVLDPGDQHSPLSQQAAGDINAVNTHTNSPCNFKTNQLLWSEGIRFPVQVTLGRDV